MHSSTSLRTQLRKGTKRRTQGGFVLIVVLLTLVILTLTAALVLDQATTNVEISGALRAYSVAQARAAAGVNHMRAELSGGAGIARLSNLTVCPAANLATDTCPLGSYTPLTTGMGPNTTVDPTGLVTVSPDTAHTELMEGIGYQYRVYVANIGTNTCSAGGCRLFIVSTGYYGLPAAAPLPPMYGVREARVQVEIALPSGVKDKPCPSGVEGSC
jgi:Tfp pilus assembly protein PilX